MMLPRTLLLLCLAAWTFGCGDKSADTKKDDSSKDSDDDDDDKKKKKDKDKKGDKAKGSADASASAAPSAAPTAAATGTPTATAAPTPPPAPADPLATLFTGDPDPAIKFLRQKQIPNEPVWIQVVPYWDANTDQPSPNDPYTTLDLRGKDKHAYIGMGLYKADPTFEAKRLSNHCAWATATSCTFKAPIDGTLGKGLKMKIAEGTAEIMRKPAKVWWMTGPVKDKELFVFVALRTDVWPKLEGEAMAMLKTVKVAGP